MSKYVDLTLYSKSDESDGCAQYLINEHTEYSHNADFVIDGKGFTVGDPYSEIEAAGFTTNANTEDVMDAFTGGGYNFMNSAREEFTVTLYNNTNKSGALNEVCVIDGVSVDLLTFPELPFSICGIENNTEIREVLKELGNPNTVTFTYFSEVNDYSVDLIFDGQSQFLTVSINGNGELWRVTFDCFI